MNNFYLLNEAIDLTDFDRFKKGMLELNAIEKEKDDSFWKHDCLWKLQIIQKLFSNFGQEEQVISQFIEQTTSKDGEYINNEENLNTVFPDEGNAFLGIDFTNLEIREAIQVNNIKSFTYFKSIILEKLSFREVWNYREKLFPHLILCDQVKEQLNNIGESPILKQIISRLKTFDNAVAKWEKGVFSYKIINKNFSLTISPESDQTMAKYGDERCFKLPNGKKEKFILHIKTGALRFHFFPDNYEKKVYIGYIGPHLNTISG